MKLTHIRSSAVAAALLTTLATVGGATAQAQVQAEIPGQNATRAAEPGHGDCVDSDGINLNEELNMKGQQIIGPTCITLYEGEPWRLNPFGWSTRADGTKNIFTDGYRPAFAEDKPVMRDFHSKFQGAQAVLDDGTKKKTYTFGQDSMRRVTKVTYGEEEADRALFASRVLKPLCPGTYEVHTSLIMAEEHWDAFGTNPAVNKLERGANPAHTFDLEVKPREGGPRSKCEE